MFRDDPDMSPEKFAGMADVVQILAHFKFMTDDDIEIEVRNRFKNLKL